MLHPPLKNNNNHNINTPTIDNRSDAPGETSETADQVAARESYARSVYERAYRSMRETQPDAKEEALALLEAWKDFESEAKSRWVLVCVCIHRGRGAQWGCMHVYDVQ